MIDKFIELFDKNRENLEKVFSEKHPEEYTDIVREVVKILKNSDYNYPDPERIHRIDDGDYQGTLVFIIGEEGYQPSNYWYVKVYYGSCSGCDTLQSITDYSSDAPTESQVKEYMTLALHIVQGLKAMQEE